MLVTIQGDGGNTVNYAMTEMSTRDGKQPVVTVGEFVASAACYAASTGPLCTGIGHDHEPPTKQLSQEITMRTAVLTVVVLPILLCSCSSTTVNKIALERRRLSEEIPPACSQQRLLAEEAFRSKWIAHLLEPAETVLVQPSTQATENVGTYLAPVQSYRIAHDEWTLTNRMVSAFVNCEKNEGYVQARGGVIDQEDWFGPFKF